MSTNANEKSHKRGTTFFNVLKIPGKKPKDPDILSEIILLDLDESQQSIRGSSEGDWHPCICEEYWMFAT